MRYNVSDYSLYVQLFCCHDNGPIFTTITVQLIFIYLTTSTRYSKYNAHFALWHIAIPISFVSLQGAVSFLIHISCATVPFNNHWSNTSMDKKITFLLLYNFHLFMVYVTWLSAAEITSISVWLKFKILWHDAWTIEIVHCYATEVNRLPRKFTRMQQQKNYCFYATAR